MALTAVLIPARYGSTRYEGKPLCDLNGKPMIVRVTEECKKSGLDVFVLTDHKLIAEAAKTTGVKTYIDSHPYENGTERCAGAIKSSLFDKYVKFINVQGDMPDITADMIKRTKFLLDLQYKVATLYTDMEESLKENPNSVKLIKDKTGRALWFGRGFTGYGDHHLGVYGYQRKALTAYSDLERFDDETIEGLEQLRWLRNGYSIQCGHVEFNGTEINTPEDVEKWRKSNGN